MFTLSLTADSPRGWCKIWEIETELYNFEKEVFPDEEHIMNY